MISRRRASKYTQDIEQLQQNSFTAFRGIDVSKAPVSQDTLLDAENLDVDYDGGLILRKPLLYSNKYSYTDYIHYTYEGTPIAIQNTDTQNLKIDTIKISDIYNTVHTKHWDNKWLRVFKISKENTFVNTPSSTLILNIRVNTSDLEETFKEIYKEEVLFTKFGSKTYDYTQAILKLLKNPTVSNEDTPTWTLEVIFPETNIVSSNDIAIDFNTMLENPLAICDNYHAAQTYIQGIVSYSPLMYLTQAVSLPYLTESGAFKINSNDVNSDGYTVLKAFLDKPNITDLYSIVLRWEMSDDGVTWEMCEGNNTDLNSLQVVNYSLNNNDLESTKTIEWKVEKWYLLDDSSFEKVYTEQVSIHKRPDCLIINNSRLNSSKVFKCTLLKIKKSSESPYYDLEDFPKADTKKLEYIKDYEICSKTYFFNPINSEFIEQDLKNPMTGTITYYNHALYSISPEFKNNIYVSNPDSAVFPVSRIIDLGTFQENTVTKLIPWRDYLVAFTSNSVHLIKEQEVGFTTKTVNTFIGVPERDANTCVSILNGIIFKSDNKLYSLIPNYNSGDESILNISDISKPIEHILDNLTYNDDINPFAFTTSDSYYLFIPREADTLCLKYNYSRKIWTKYTYPVVFYDFKIMDVSDIRLFTRKDSSIIEYYFEKEPSDIQDYQIYGDYLTTSKDSSGDYIVRPINFFVDSGQKTDNLSLTKQFVESKIIVATLADKDSFKMDVNVAIEGNVFKKHVDLNTDGALLRNNPNQVLTLGSSAESSNSDTFNVVRQMFVRYSGKGKTIRHVISGTSLYKFKIYETFYRYKLLNVKQ